MESNTQPKESVDYLANILWHYLDFDCVLKPVDFILALGSHDLRVAHRAAELYRAGFAKWLVVSGGYGKVTSYKGDVPEAIRFAEIATAQGVPKDNIIVETKAQNTGENFLLVRELLSHDNRVSTQSAIVVTKPYMKRRAFATACKQWPEVNWSVTGPEVTYEDYPKENISKDEMVSVMVGDLQRMKVYADKGFQIQQDIPPQVWNAYEKLVDLGFDKYVIKGHS